MPALLCAAVYLCLALPRPAGSTLSRPNAYWPTFQNLTLPGQPGITYLGACCNRASWPSQRDVLDRGVMVVQSDLQAAFVEQQGRLVAWVTTSQGASSPVQGAMVQLYSSAYNAVSPGWLCWCPAGPASTGTARRNGQLWGLLSFAACMQEADYGLLLALACKVWHD